MTLLTQRENCDFGCNGTGHANLYESSGPYLPAPRFSTWGGACNSATRQSDSISLEKALEVVEAAQRAIAIGRPFNRHLTVHWEKAGLTDAQAAAATGSFVKLIVDWARRHGGTSYAWVRENGERKGSHTHILLHVPQGLSLALTRRWYRTVTGWQGKLPSKAVRTVCIGGSARCALAGGEHYSANLAYVVSYLLKGVDEHGGIALDLDRYASGGEIQGKRVSISGSLRDG